MNRDAKVPPYWTPVPSFLDVSPSASQITLVDRSSLSNTHSQSCWAQSVTIPKFTIVSSSIPDPANLAGAYVVFHINITLLNSNGVLSIQKRYSDFDRLRRHLVMAFPHAENMIPMLPRKSLVSRFRPVFLEQRRLGLNHFLNCVLLNPEFAASPVLKEFVF
ncbi:Phox-like protein [Piedraia hortae CBS 480.64]|uniref:Endosomal/vacuolar adapter protein YPT35 n=1 Tax=Piedraia hortae CBS 480.64 TaxID=1314780 RepID=A0A6A7C872_9PEZI|nr:Phox-like protein [Piedraia hortae CBS 480.64]